MANRNVDKNGNELLINADGSITVSGSSSLTSSSTGVYNSTKPTLTTGQRGDLQLGSRGSLAVQLLGADSATPMATAAPADALGGQNSLWTLAIAENWNGASFDRVRTPNVFKTIATVAIGTEATIWTPTASKKFRLMGLALSVSAAVSITLKDNTGGTTILIVPTLAINTPIFLAFGNGILSAAANNVLTATGSAAANLSGFVFGTEE